MTKTTRTKYPVEFITHRRKVVFHRNYAELYRWQENYWSQGGYWDYMGARIKEAVRGSLKSRTNASVQLGCQRFLRSSGAVAFAKKWVKRR